MKYKNRWILTINNINVLTSSYKVSDISSVLNQVWGFSTDFRKKPPPRIKFHENLTSGSHADACRQTDRRTDMKKLMSAFRFLYERVCNTPDTELGIERPVGSNLEM